MAHESLREWLRRWLTTVEQVDDHDLGRQAEEWGVVPMDEAAPRSRVTVLGAISDISHDSRNQWLQADITDGTGTVRLIWMAYDKLDCLARGRDIRASGRLSQRDGRPVIFNPDFEVID